MKIVVVKKINNNECSTDEFDIIKGKPITIDSVKAEKKVPIKKWFRVVGYRLVMYPNIIMSIKVRSISKDSFTFIIEEPKNFQSKVEERTLKRGENFSIKTNELGMDNEYIFSIKEEK